MINFDNTEIAFAIRDNAELKRSHFIFSMMKYPILVKLGTFLALFSLKLKLPVKKLIKQTLFYQFCGGESIEGCKDSIANLARFNVKTILDFSSENHEDDATFNETLSEVLETANLAKNHPDIPFCVVKLTGLGSKKIMSKVQAGQDLNEEEQASYKRFKDRVDQIARTSFENGIRFMIDAEETWIQDVIDQVGYEMMLKYNKERPVVYNTYQFYCHETLKKMKKGYEMITEAGCFFAAKFVRGAYMEKERDRAEELGYQDPIQPNKPATDSDFNLAQEFAIEHIENFSVLSGTHNDYSCAYLAELMHKNGIEKGDERVYFSQLLGMSDNISFKLSAEGYNVAKYMPYGPVEKVLPYLFRRAKENTAIKGQGSREYMLINKEVKRRKGK